jgi:hypothetical protein
VGEILDFSVLAEDTILSKRRRNYSEFEYYYDHANFTLPQDSEAILELPGNGIRP